MGKALDLIMSEPWLIQPEAMINILAIAQRNLDSQDLLAARQGKTLENARNVELIGSTAVIPVRGPIFRYANMFTEISGATSLEVLANDFAKARDSRKIDRIVLSLDTPGGQATGIAEFAEIIADTTNKPVVAHAGDLALSAGYWIASAAMEITTSPTGMLGSIGVVGTYRPDDSNDIQIVSTQSPLKRPDPRTEEGMAELQSRIDDLADVFIDRVAGYRGITSSDVKNGFGRGGVLVGQKAVDAGMSDRVATLDSILAGEPGSTMEAYMPTKQQAKEPEITREYLQANHADIYAEIMTEGAEQARSLMESDLDVRTADIRSAAAESERNRIMGVFAQSIPGHEALVERLAFDGSTTAEQAALQILSAEKSLRSKASKDLADTTPKPVAGNSTESGESNNERSFDDIVSSLEQEGMTHAKAMRQSVSDHPEAHRKWLARINKLANG